MRKRIIRGGFAAYSWARCNDRCTGKAKRRERAEALLVRAGYKI